MRKMVPMLFMWKHGMGKARCRMLGLGNSIVERPSPGMWVGEW